MKRIFVNVKVEVIKKDILDNHIKDKYYDDLKHYYLNYGLVSDVILELRGDEILITNRPENLLIAQELRQLKIDAVLMYDEETAVTHHKNLDNLTIITLEDMRKKELKFGKDWHLNMFFYEDDLDEKRLLWVEDQVRSYHNSYKSSLDRLNFRDFSYNQSLKCIEFKSFYLTEKEYRSAAVKFKKLLTELNSHNTIRSINGIPIDVFLPS